ncbi:MAG: HAD family hydrolase [Clostridiales bacterium]|nr:HAD family hydrolase [Clostridiales bacterium]
MRNGKSMKTLYITDLDGTLLNHKAELSNKTISIINKLIDDGVLITVATARSIASAKYILKDLNLKLPIVLMNGACIYDTSKEEYIKVESFSKENARILIDIIEKNNLKGFLYTLDMGKFNTYYEDLTNHALRAFHQERVYKYNKSFTLIDNFSQCINETIIYFTLMDSKANLEQINLLINDLPNINSVLCQDNYDPNICYLEIFSNKASKYHAVKFLRSYLSLDRIIGFGDNQNDISLFEACDTNYAVKNAIDGLKERADGIIDENIKDGVALWLNKHALKST